jgi:chromosome segregation ATPase
MSKTGAWGSEVSSEEACLSAVAAWKKNCQDLIVERDDWKQKHDQVQKKHFRATDKIKKLAEELGEAKKRNVELSRELVVRGGEELSAKNDSETCNSIADQLAKTLDTVEADRDELRASLAEALLRNEELTGIFNKTRERTEELSHANNALVRKIASMILEVNTDSEEEMRVHLAKIKLELVAAGVLSLTLA